MYVCVTSAFSKIEARPAAHGTHIHSHRHIPLAFPMPLSATLTSAQTTQRRRSTPTARYAHGGRSLCFHPAICKCLFVLPSSSVCHTAQFSRFRGVRQLLNWHEDKSMRAADRDYLSDPRCKTGGHAEMRRRLMGLHILYELLIGRNFCFLRTLAGGKSFPCSRSEICCLSCTSISTRYILAQGRWSSFCSPLGFKDGSPLLLF